MKSNASSLSSSEVQKLASLGYVGLEKTAGVASSAPTGTDPKDVVAQANEIGRALQNLWEGKVDKALAMLQPMASANIYMAQYGLGVALARKKQYSQAIEHLHKAIELQPNSAWAHYEMGGSLLKTGDFKTAAVHLELACARLPKFRGARSLLADCYEHLGRGADAQLERKKAGE